MDGSERPRGSGSCAELEPDSVDEDREIASSAVLLVLGGVRKGTVHLCSAVAELMRENRRLRRTVEAQRAQIRLLRSMPPAARAMWPQTRTPSSASCYSSASLSTSQDFGVSPSCSSSGRGSLSPGVPLPILPPLSPPQNNVSTAHRRVATVHSPRQTGQQDSLELQVPLTQPHPSSPPFCRRASSKWERKPEELSPEKDVQASEKKQKKKKTSSIYKEDLSIEPDFANLGLKWRCSPEPSSSSQCDAREGSSHTSRSKHRLKMNDRVVLNSKQKGVVRFIGPLENSTTGEVFIGVELDTACGESDGTFHGIRYFKCKPNCGTFTTVSHLKKLSKQSSPQSQPITRTDSSDSDGGATSAKGPKSRLRRTRNQKNVAVLVHWEPESGSGTS
ncbi:CAP-Gly domain-containing linker protein 4-like isoform X2 [Scleropages formosus]|uniref:CAP-Gly domain-containing linker protein 4-like isoform X2 n=1 Tax=Scleropages formosus TaxID=113540 RepID=UPI000878EBEC|nr:CAP-Gly domain-containing linker protein 4-like isoform X2 [Scleropages formosus]